MYETRLPKYLQGNILLSSVKNKLCVSPVFAMNLVKALSISLFCVAAFSRIASYSVTGCLCVYKMLHNGLDDLKIIYYNYIYIKSRKFTGVLIYACGSGKAGK